MSISLNSETTIHETAFVRLPEHEYFNNRYPANVVGAFNEFSRAATSFFDYNPNYPNAQLLISPWPVNMQKGKLDFIIAWGKSTEIPLPRQEKLVEYFGQLANKRSSKLSRIKTSREKVVLDAYGFAGVIFSEPEIHTTVLRAITGLRNKTVQANDYPLFSASGSEMATLDILANLKIGRPLRFHQSVIWWPRNGYVGNNFYPDDDHRSVSKYFPFYN